MTRRALTAMSYLLVLEGCVSAEPPASPPDSAPLAVQGPGAVASLPDGEQPAEDSPPGQRPEAVVLRYPTGPRPWLGVEMRATPPDQAGVEIQRVLRGSPADRSGLLPGDVLLRLGDQAIDSPEQLARLVDEATLDEGMPVALQRGGVHRLVRVKLEGKPQFEDRLRLAFVGLPAPSIDGVVTFQGHVASLSDVKGQVVLLEFWASWCGVCRYLSPVLNRLHLQHRPEGLAVLGITVDSPAKGQQVALATRAMDYGLASDEAGRVTRQYLAAEVPTVFVIDRRGVVVDVMVGVAAERIAELEQLVEDLLGREG